MRDRSMFVFVALGCVVGGAAQEPKPKPDLLFGGCGGVYLLAEPGELRIDVFKRDKNRRRRHTDLRAILVGPDRHVLQEATLPDDGRSDRLGPLQSMRLSTRVARKGVFALNITVSQDRYGEAMVWGFRTNCRRYLVETARGHKDERHTEPIVLYGTGGPATVCFLPRRGKFDLDVSGLAHDAPALRIVDAKGELVRKVVPEHGRAACTVPADVHRDAVPWCLELPSNRATVTIDGVTQWAKGDPYPDLCVWTPDPASWFALLPNWWLLIPYNTTAYARAGTEGSVSFHLHNNSRREKSVGLSLEFPGSSWPVHLSRDRVKLAPGASSTVVVRFTAPRELADVHVRATPEGASGFTTYSTLTVRAGAPPKLTVPMKLQPYRHENALLSYRPAYPTENQPYFDQKNRPFIVSGSRLHARRDGRWMTKELPGSSLTTKVAFDRKNGVYLIARVRGRASLLHSADGGRTFATYPIPGRSGTFDIEQFSGHNGSDGPPPFVRFTRTATDPKRIWRRINDLELFVPRRVDGHIEIGEPILITRACIGLSSHSGIPSSIVSRGPKVHVVWGEATDPKKRVPGVPTYAITYDRVTKRLGTRSLIGYGPPANDVHNSPSITMDSEGYLHVLIGTHGQPFQYSKSKAPNDAGAGWTRPVAAGKKLRQTYIGFVCGKDDTLYVVYRLWRTGAPYRYGYHATLAFQRKRPGKPWEPPKILVVAPFSEYSIFYHRLTIDRSGRLFVSKDYWSTYWFYRNDLPGRRGQWRALLMSADGGDTFGLAADSDFAG